MCGGVGEALHMANRWIPPSLPAAAAPFVKGEGTALPLAPSPGSPHPHPHLMCVCACRGACAVRDCRARPSRCECVGVEREACCVGIFLSPSSALLFPTTWTWTWVLPCVRGADAFRREEAASELKSISGRDGAGAKRVEGKRVRWLVPTF